MNVAGGRESEAQLSVSRSSSTAGSGSCRTVGVSGPSGERRRRSAGGRENRPTDPRQEFEGYDLTLQLRLNDYTITILLAVLTVNCRMACGNFVVGQITDVAAVFRGVRSVHTFDRQYSVVFLECNSITRQKGLAVSCPLFGVAGFSIVTKELDLTRPLRGRGAGQPGGADFGCE